MAPKKKAEPKKKKKAVAKAAPFRMPGAPDGVEGLVPIPHKWQSHGGAEPVTLEDLTDKLMNVAKDRAASRSGADDYKELLMKSANFAADKRYIDMMEAAKERADKDGWNVPFVSTLMPLLHDVATEEDFSVRAKMLDQVYDWFQRHENSLDPRRPDAPKDLDETGFWNFQSTEILPGSTRYPSPPRSYAIDPDKEKMLASSLSPPLTPSTMAPRSRPMSAMSSHFTRPTSAASSRMPFSSASSRPQSATFRSTFSPRSRPTSATQRSRPTSAHRVDSPPSSAAWSRPTSAQMSRPTSAGTSRPTSAQWCRPAVGLAESRPTSARPESRPTSARPESRPTSAQPATRSNVAPSENRPPVIEPTSVPSLSSSRHSMSRLPTTKPFNPNRRVENSRTVPQRFSTLSAFRNSAKSAEEDGAFNNMTNRWVASRNKDILKERFTNEVQEAVDQWATRSSHFEEDSHRKFHSHSAVDRRNETLKRDAALDLEDVEEEEVPPVPRHIVAPETHSAHDGPAKRHSTLDGPEVSAHDDKENHYKNDLHLRKLADIRSLHRGLLHEPAADMPIATTLVEDDLHVDLEQVCELWQRKHACTYQGNGGNFFEQERMEQLQAVEKIKMLRVPVSDRVLRDALVAPVRAIKPDSTGPGLDVPRLLINPLMPNQLALLTKKKKKGAKKKAKAKAKKK